MRRKTKIIFSVLTMSLLFVAANAPVNNKYFEIAKNLELFTSVYKELNTNYVDELDPGELMKLGVDAMLNSLDPYTVYYSEQQVEGYRMQSQGKFTGIGAKIQKIENDFMILAVNEDAPAQKGGLRPGDQIIQIDGNDITDKKQEDLAAILNGAEGTQVKLQVTRKGSFKNKEFLIKRSEVTISNVPYHGMLNDNVGYINLTTFTANASKNIANAYNELKDDNTNMNALVLDLRSNGGGLLREAIAICNLFVPQNELVVSTKGKVKDRDKNYYTKKAPLDLNVPIAVLINDHSASASEIVSGVIQDLDRGVLIGQRSYGKGLVQNTMDLGYNSKIKLTTSKYFIPSGRCIQGVEYDENGNPVDIPESKRAAFKTKNGRTVYDGGGVKPDLLLPNPNKIPLIKAFNEQFIIFKFVNEYIDKVGTIENVEDFHFSDWAAFTSFLKSTEFNFKTDSETALEKLIDNTKEENIDVSQLSKQIQSQITSKKESALNEHKEIIVDKIEKEIVSRSYYQAGKVKIGLRNDAEIKEAISILNDKNKYQSFLK